MTGHITRYQHHFWKEEIDMLEKEGKTVMKVKTKDVHAERRDDAVLLEDTLIWLEKLSRLSRMATTKKTSNSET